jgi:hypothetical protein
MPSTRHICAIGALLTALTACGSATADPSTPFTPRPNADDLFMMALTHFGIRVTADNIAKTIAVGHQVCTYVGQGHTPMEAVHEVASNNNHQSTRSRRARCRRDLPAHGTAP